MLYGTVGYDKGSECYFEWNGESLEDLEQNSAVIWLNYKRWFITWRAQWRESPSLICKIREKFSEEHSLNVERLGRLSWVRVEMRDGGWCGMFSDRENSISTFINRGMVCSGVGHLDRQIQLLIRMQYPTIAHWRETTMTWAGRKGGWERHKWTEVLEVAVQQQWKNEEAHENVECLDGERRKYTEVCVERSWWN